MPIGFEPPGFVEGFSIQGDMVTQGGESFRFGSKNRLNNFRSQPVHEHFPTIAAYVLNSDEMFLLFVQIVNQVSQEAFGQDCLILREPQNLEEIVEDIIINKYQLVLPEYLNN